MNYIFEAIFIGLYSLLLYVPINLLFKNVSLVFFVTGFLKHFLGYFIGIHTLYCKINGLEIAKINFIKLVLESLFEGLLFLILGLIISSKSKRIEIFIIGFFLHIIFELIGLHRVFINGTCT